MKSKVKYAALVLVIGLLGLVILASPVFGGGPKTYEYHIIIDIKNKNVAEFEAYGNKDGTRIVGYEKYQMGYVPVSMDFPKSVVEQLDPAEDEAANFNDYLPSPIRPLNWSPLEDDWQNKLGLVECDQFSLDDHLQDLDSDDWEYHSGSLDYKKETLSFRFDLFYKYYDDYDEDERRGAHDHYVLGIEMESWENGVSGNATLNWTHYTEPIKERGKNLRVDFQQLKCNFVVYPVTITIIKEEVKAD